MSQLPFTITAYFFNAIATTVDKFLLTRSIPNPLVYIFYFSLFSALALVLLPFTHIPSGLVFLLSSASTVLWTSGAYFMFKALQIGQVDRVVPIIGTLVPIILLVEAIFTGTITERQIIAVGLLIFGLVVITAPSWKGRFIKIEIAFEILASVLFAISYVILRQAYLRDNFLTVFVWSRFVIIPVGLLIFIIPKLHHIVFESSEKRPAFSLFSRAGILFLGGQAAGGLSELLITFSISLANPALVNSLQGTQYVFLFLFSLVLSRYFPQIYQESLSKINLASKILGIAAISVGLYFLAT